MWNGWNARGKVNELPDKVLRCWGLLFVSTEATDDADVDAFEAVDDVRCREEASDETVDSLDPAFGPPTL